MSRLAPVLLAALLLACADHSAVAPEPALPPPAFGLVVTPENRCAEYDPDDYPYTADLEREIVLAQGGRIYEPYTGRVFLTADSTQVEHIVALSEAHDSGMCARSDSVKAAFASHLLDLTLASAAVNTEKGGMDAAEWLPVHNRCWYAGRVVAVKAAWNLTADQAEADSLAAILTGCDSTEMDFGPPPANPTDTTATQPPPPPPPPAPSSFGPGVHLVGSEVEAGRYFADPGDGCYWERLSGLGGTFAEILANQYIADDEDQEIVDIARTDIAFSGDSDCGTWTKDTPVASPGEGTIPPGRWLIADGQLAPGTYTANNERGCYWERLSAFSGNLSDVIDNDFVSVAGVQTVTVLASDAGFYGDADCGTWSLVGGASAGIASAESSLEDRARNRRANRADWPRRR